MIDYDRSLATRYTVVAPVLVCEIVNDEVWAVVISVVSVSSLALMNEVARQVRTTLHDSSARIAWLLIFLFFLV